MTQFAVIKTGGKQYIAREGEALFIEKIDTEVGKTHTFDEVLFTDNGTAKVGNPTTGTKVTAKVLEHGRGDKIVVVHYLQKSRYHKKNGHRQPYTKVQFEKVA